MQLQAHLNLLEELQQEVRTFRHDLINLMEGTTQRAADGDLKGIQEFLQSIGAYFDEKLGNEIQQLESVSNIKIYPLQSLITAKTAKMQEKGEYPNCMAGMHSHEKIFIQEIRLIF